MDNSVVEMVDSRSSDQRMKKCTDFQNLGTLAAQLLTRQKRCSLVNWIIHLEIDQSINFFKLIYHEHLILQLSFSFRCWFAAVLIAQSVIVIQCQNSNV